jgi:hypothetical protein
MLHTSRGKNYKVFLVFTQDVEKHETTNLYVVRFSWWKNKINNYLHHSGKFYS